MSDEMPPDADLRVIGALIISLKHTADALFASYGQYLSRTHKPAQAEGGSSAPHTFMNKAANHMVDRSPE